ncbi:NAD-dependent epimerase/dehydratase [Beggiatoa sp. PS]|nr:NAD-dependent epimerase/dehydratase [Beggiatoa sp. PS]
MNRLSGKTILVTGATGFIGQHLVHRLLRIPDIRLIVVSRKPNTQTSGKILWITSPVEQLTPAIWQANGIDKIDLVFHLGAFIPKKADDANLITEIYRDNLLGTRALLESVPSPLERIIFASTIDVYATPLADNLVLDEFSVVEPSGLYGASKLFCESLIRAYAREHENGYAILRYGHIFGPGEEAYHKLIPQTIRQLLQGKSPTLYGNGSTKRDFLYIDDVIEATLRTAIDEKQEIGPLNIVRGVSKPIRDIVNLLIKIIEFSGEIEFILDKPEGYSLNFDNSKMRETLGNWNFVSLEEGLRREVEWFRRLA